MMEDAVGLDRGGSPVASPGRRRRVRVCYFNTWAGSLADAADYAGRASGIELTPFVSDPADKGLMQRARLDCDWYAENARCFAAMAHPELEFLPARVCGRNGVVDWARAAEPGVERWFITMGQQPQALRDAAGPAFALLARAGVRHLYYAFDEASRTMPCFRAIAPHLDVLIHDESPLDPAAAAALRPACRRIHRSWVANLLPFAAEFNEAPEEKILFLGSQLGLTPHRERQISFLQRKFKERFSAYHDHSIAVNERTGLARFKVALCPEGRKFTTPAMRQTHTDRPFWSGCLGIVPVSEDSRQGGRLEALHQAGLVLRYAHGDLVALQHACERALAMDHADRRRLYEHFNREETIGRVVAKAIAAA